MYSLLLAPVVAATYLFGATGVIGALISLLVVVLAIIVVLWVVQLALTALGITLPPNVWLIIRVILALIVLAYALQIFGVLA